uniref:Ig-like domain-containing protein n=1 Tax=Megaselia scalaris TaxID=36166 RepID=T1GJ75_MEGSC
MSHGGNYTCAPANAKPSSITVHVLRGERPAAMQHSNRSTFEGELSNGITLNTSSTSLFSSSSGIRKTLEIDKLYNLLFLIFFRK